MFVATSLFLSFIFDYVNLNRSFFNLLKNGGFFYCFCYREEKVEEPELPKYRDRAKERREDQNPDYELTEFGGFHAVAPPGNIDLL